MSKNLKEFSLFPNPKYKNNIEYFVSLSKTKTEELFKKIYKTSELDDEKYNKIKKSLLDFIESDYKLMFDIIKFEYSKIRKDDEIDVLFIIEEFINKEFELNKGKTESEKEESKQCIKLIFKIYNHIEITISNGKELDEIRELSKSSITELGNAKKEIENIKSNIWSNLLVVVGVFLTLGFAVNSSVSVIGSMANILQHGSTVKLIYISIFTVLAITNIVAISLDMISSLIKQKDEKTSFFKTIIYIDVIFLVLFGLFSYSSYIFAFLQL